MANKNNDDWKDDIEDTAQDAKNKAEGWMQKGGKAHHNATNKEDDMSDTNDKAYWNDMDED